MPIEKENQNFRRERIHNSGQRFGFSPCTYLDESHNQPGIDVPLNVAVEQPYARIIAPEPHHKVPVRLDEQHVSAHRPARKDHTAIADGLWVEVAGILIAP